MGNPITDQCRLTITCRGRDKRQLPVAPRVQTFNQAWARDEVPAGWRSVELGGEERIGHQNLPLVSDFIELLADYEGFIISCLHTGKTRIESC